MRLKVRRFFFSLHRCCVLYGACESLVKWHLCTVSCMYVETFVQNMCMVYRYNIDTIYVY